MIDFDFLHAIGAVGLIINGTLIFKFRSHVLKIILFTFWYPLLPMLLFSIGVPLGGSIDVIGRPVYAKYALEAYFWALAGFFTLVIVLRNLKNEEFKIKRLKIGEGIRLFLILALLITSIIAYPRAWGLSESRWNLLPGQWSVVYLSLNGILILSFKSLKSISTLIHLVILLLVIKGGERVDSIMCLFLLIALQADKQKVYLIEGRIGVLKILLGISVLVLGISVGYTRMGNSFSLPVLLHNIVAMHTVTDVIHVYFSSFNYIADYGINLSPLVNEMFSFVPFHPWGGAGNEFNFTEILRSVTYNYGGGLFYSEGVLLFGKIGVLIYSFLFGKVIQTFFKYRHQAVSVISIIFLILLLRIQWYGMVYLYTPLILAILFVGFYNIVKSLNLKSVDGAFVHCK